MIGAASVYDMANQFDLYDNGGLDICFMGALEVDKQGNVNAHRGPGAFAGGGCASSILVRDGLQVSHMRYLFYSTITSHIFSLCHNNTHDPTDIPLHLPGFH